MYQAPDQELCCLISSGVVLVVDKQSFQHHTGGSSRNIKSSVSAIQMVFEILL